MGPTMFALGLITGLMVGVTGGVAIGEWNMYKQNTSTESAIINGPHKCVKYEVIKEEEK